MMGIPQNDAFRAFSLRCSSRLVGIRPLLHPTKFASLDSRGGPFLKKKPKLHHFAKVLMIGILLAAWLPASDVAAQNLNRACEVDEDSALCQEHRATRGNPGGRLYGPDGLLTRIANLVSLVVGIAAVVMLMIGGFRYIRSSGDANSTSQAQNTIIYALVGLAVAVVGQLLVVFVLNRLT